MQSVRAKDDRARLRAGCASASSRTAPSTTSPRKLEELYKQDPNLKGLVLDLRNDPGGLLEGAVGIAAAFLPTDAVVVTTNGQIPESKADLQGLARRTTCAAAAATR